MSAGCGHCGNPEHGVWNCPLRPRPKRLEYRVRVDVLAVGDDTNETIKEFVILPELRTVFIWELERQIAALKPGTQATITIEIEEP